MPSGPNSSPPYARVANLGENLPRTRMTWVNMGLGRRARATVLGVSAQAQQYKDRNRPPRERSRIEAGLCAIRNILIIPCPGCPVCTHFGTFSGPISHTHYRARHTTDTEVEGSTHWCVVRGFRRFWPLGESCPSQPGDHRPTPPRALSKHESCCTEITHLQYVLRLPSVL
jgi:hypothetical protein